MLAPTPIQSRIRAFIQEWVDAHQQSPTYDEIRIRFGFASKATVNGHLLLMEKKGILRRPVRFGHRAIRLTGATNAPLSG